MHLADQNWMQVEAYLRADDRLMLVVGACEQHGYLSLLTDIKIPLALAEAAAAETGVLVAPPLSFGISPSFAAYPGTLSLRTRTFLRVVEDLVRAAHGQGFRRLLFVNGHGGNAPATAVLTELLAELPHLDARWFSWWTCPAVTSAAEAAGLKSYHAGWIEAFPFCRVAALPAGEKAPVDAGTPRSPRRAREAYGDGVFGGPYAADEELLQRVFDAAVAELVGRLAFAD